MKTTEKTAGLGTAKQKRFQGLPWSLASIVIAAVNLTLHFIKMIQLDQGNGVKEYSVLDFLNAPGELEGFFAAFGWDAAREKMLLNSLHVALIAAMVLIALTALWTLVPAFTGKPYTSGRFLPLSICVILSFLIQMSTVVFLYVNARKFDVDGLDLVLGFVFYNLSAVASPVLIGGCGTKADANGKH